MVPFSYEMVDMGGIDLAEANHTVVEGIYSKIVDAVTACGDVILYNWSFAEIPIPPSAYSTIVTSDGILINGLIQVTELDEVNVLGIEPPPPPIVPVIPLEVTENGVYTAEPPSSGFNPVSVSVVADIPLWLHYFDDAPDDSVGNNGDVGLVAATINLRLVPIHAVNTVNDIAGQNQSTAFRAFDDNSGTFWTTNDRNYNDMYIGYNFYVPTPCNGVSIMPRQWNNVVQIHEFRVEGSNDLLTWDTIFEGEIVNNIGNVGVWNNFSFDEVTYSAYRLVALSLNTSVTFTIFGLQFNRNNMRTVDVYTKVNGHWLFYK